MEDDHKEVRFGIMGEGQELSEEDESRIDEAVGGVAASMAHQIGLQKQQQQLIIRWERFLPVRVLKVLLVENDDSTRQVVSALLRNCSYEVTGVTNGLQAWKILEDLTNHIDLVLTEVVMPCLSGIGLLYKIMSHKTCKNIPVIMMSSNDSMGTVFKCLSEGAVDFLVKPIRKNELKNLWQHVWRRCHSSSISGSESGNQTQKPPKSKSADDSNNNTGSYDEDSSGSINARDGSDNGSGTQNSSTKRAIEVNSPRPLSPSDQLTDRHDNACVQVIHPKIETFSNEWVPMTANGECTKQKETADDFMGKDLEIGVPRNLHTQHESYPTDKVSTKLASKSVDELPESDAKNECLLGLESSNASDKPSMKAADLIGVVANCTETQLLTRDIESLNGCSKVSGGKGKAIDSSMELPTFDLSLKRRRTTREGGTSTHDDRNVLRHSNHSAFSRYHTSAAASQAPTGYGGSCSPLDNNSEEVKAESTPNMMSNSNPAPAKHGPNGGSDNNDMGSTTKNFFTKPAFKEKIADASSVLCAHPSAFHPVNLRKPSIPQVMQEKIDDVNSAAIGGQLGGIQHQVQVQHSHHHYYHHHLHVHSMQQLPDYDDLSLKTMAEDAPHCGSSNVFAGQMEGNPAIYSLNQSNSGTNHGSNGQNGSSAAINAGGINIESANGITERSWAVGGNGSGSGSGSGVDQNRFAQREAALNKFRLKRKERNFQKKVRYQSRKRLAEQRPRVRGQFVRHSMYEHTSQEADS